MSSTKLFLMTCGFPEHCRRADAPKRKSLSPPPHVLSRRRQMLQISGCVLHGSGHHCPYGRTYQTVLLRRYCVNSILLPASAVRLSTPLSVCSFRDGGASLVQLLRCLASSLPGGDRARPGEWISGSSHSREPCR